MIDINIVIDDLQLDELKNINMINFLTNNPIHLIKTYDGAYIAKGISDEFWIYNSCKNKDQLNKLLPFIEDTKHFVTQTKWEHDIITEGKEIDWSLECNKMYLKDDVSLVDSKYSAKTLTLCDTNYIFENSKYKDVASNQYIYDCISRDTALGIYDKDRLVAWSMIHDDGSIGFLNVLDSHRRQGIGESLMVEMIKTVRAKGKIPFVHVEESNVKSMNLMDQLGFTTYGKICWLKLK